MTITTKLTLGVLSSYCWIDENTLNGTNCSENLLKFSDLDAISLQQIPPIKRRRLNGLSRMAMHSSLECLQHAKIEPSDVFTVFASQHGELNRTVNIVNDLVQNEDISPKDFSLSVHNASLGLFSIFNKNKNVGTSIAANHDTFGFALLESYNILKNNPDKKVLLTCFDMQVGQPFDRLQPRPEPSYSLALVLSLEAEQTVSFAFDRNGDTQKHAMSVPPLALSFFEFIQGNQLTLQHQTPDTRWEFSKNAV